MKYFILFLLSIVSISIQAHVLNFVRNKGKLVLVKKQPKNFYELKVYEYHTMDQKKLIDQFLSEAMIPYLHKKGIGKIGAFTALDNDTSAIKKMYVLIPYKNLNEIPVINKGLFSDSAVAEKGASYLNATNEMPAFDRMMSILMEGFRFAPTLTPPSLTSSVDDKIYELRSYQSATEKKYWKKVEMFNEGGEVPLFARLGFNAVFYAEVVSGPAMPNLMYMTSFENMKDRNKHWDAFREDAAWKILSAKKEYEKTVSKNTIVFLKATTYSEY